MSEEQNEPSHNQEPKSAHDVPYRLNATEDRPTPVWDMSQERAFMETLMNQRFNFLLVFVGLVINAAVNSQSEFYFKGILSMGALTAVLLAWPIFRAHQKMNTIFAHLKNDARHPLTFVDHKHKSRWSARWLIGWGIPLLAALVLTGLMLGAFLGIIGPPKMVSQAAINERIARLEAEGKLCAEDRTKLATLSQSIERIEHTVHESRGKLHELRKPEQNKATQ